MGRVSVAHRERFARSCSHQFGELQTRQRANGSTLTPHAQKTEGDLHARYTPDIEANDRWRVHRSSVCARQEDDTMSSRSREAFQPISSRIESVAANVAGGSPGLRGATSAPTSAPVTELMTSMTSRTELPTPRPTLKTSAAFPPSQRAAAATCASARSTTWM